MAKSENTQFTENHVIREADGAPRLHLVASQQKMSHTLTHIVIDRLIGHQPRAIAEVSRPALQNAIEPSMYLLPGPYVAGYQNVLHFPPESGQTLLRRTGPQMPEAILPEVMRSKRATKEVKVFTASLLDAGFRFVQSKPPTGS